MKKLIFGLSLLALTTAAFAKTETPSKSEGTAKLNTYYVTADDGTYYSISSTPNENCGMAEVSPCEITSQNPITTGKALKAHVDAQSNGFTILERQPQL